MNENFKDLIAKFKQINKQGYIKGINNNLINSAGLTFESLLNKKADSMYFPDFKDIEIKTTQRFSRYPIVLFSTSFDGPSLYEANYLLETYGQVDKLLPEKKNLITNLILNKKIAIDNNFCFELKLSYIEKMIFINIYDKKNNFLEKRAIINFDTIKSKLNIKLQNLAVIYASKKVINNDLYFRYYKINCYKCNSFRTFLKLIKDGKIKLTLMLRVAKSGKDIGKNKNKNMMFLINKSNLLYLFDEIYNYEN